ncbi:hypothetical protein ES703_02495 [subsurface metagenome]
MKIEKIAINLLNSSKYNPRKDLQPEDIEYKKIKRSIEEFGFVDPLIINKDMTVIGGNQRIKVLKELNYKKVDCVLLDLDKTKEKALNIALNRIEGEWDLPKLKDLLLELDTGEIDMDITGFEYTDLEELMTQFYVPDESEKDDEVPEVPEEPISKLGELYELGEHRLLCGDSTKVEDVEKLMNGKKADMVFTDPPYGLGGYAGRSGKFEPMKGDDKDIRIFYNCIPKIKERYIFGNFKVFRLLDEEPRDVIVWKKNNIGMGKGYRGQYELCFYYGEFNGSDSDVWEINKDWEYKHPTQKPVALAERAILNSSIINNIILDLFGGSGSTLIACEKLKRKCYMMEIDPHYCDVIIKRYENYTNKKARLIKNDNTRT